MLNKDSTPMRPIRRQSIVKTDVPSELPTTQEYAKKGKVAEGCIFEGEFVFTTGRETCTRNFALAVGAEIYPSNLAYFLVNMALK